ncbi:DUF6445 family protein [Paraglaciecola sp.]|uniref:DUF6445 family protein n=1 Tax=Paraglaciecola sp. TaxID=1920173 RepID=UPI003EF685C3
MDEIHFSPTMKIQFLEVGQERCPLVIVDNFASHPEHLIEYAMQNGGDAPAQGYYPGVRAPAPPGYAQLLLEFVRQKAHAHFGLSAEKIVSCDSCFSMVTTPVESLTVQQSVPHFDRPIASDIAVVHYLCDEKFGGTSLYRHKTTGFEFVDNTRLEQYLHTQQKEFSKLGKPKGYVNGDTETYERIVSVEAKFNRAVFYPCANLHSGNISKDYQFVAHPQLGRFTATSFITSS